MIHWGIRPEIFSIGPITIRWYGVLFASGFLIGFQIMRKIFLNEGVSEQYLDPLLVYMAIGTIVGARLGHTLLYEPNIYLRDPIRILKVWEGGLASHGAAMGITAALYFFTRRYKSFKMYWLLDRLCIPTILAGSFIRVGNFFNSEILGKPSTLPWAVVFTRVDQVPRHPAQLYESLSYMTIFWLLYWLYWKPRVRNTPGMLFGIFMVTVFGMRFLIEFLKIDQVPFEARLPLDLGQLLSIPCVIIGAYLIVRARKLMALEPAVVEPQVILKPKSKSKRKKRR